MAGLDALVLSPGIPHLLPVPHPLAAAARAAGVPIWSDAELLFRAVRASGSRARFVGITGTNGKSTTTALVAHLLDAAGVPVAAGGNLGVPALALPILPHDGVYVLEMSSYMLERIDQVRFDVAAMLNLSPDHLDRHGDMAGYAAAKRRIFANQVGGDVAIDDVVVPHDLPPRPATLPGAHNAQNVAAALAITAALGLTRAQQTSGLATFPGLPHRLEHVADIDGVAFVNDSKATNADAAATALACHDHVVWIAGGIAKAGGIDGMDLAHVAHAFLVGRDAPMLAATLAANDVGHDIVETLERAVPAAFARARQDGATVLLSPACASFDQFSGFEARGDRFRELVLQLRAA